MVWCYAGDRLICSIWYIRVSLLLLSLVLLVAGRWIMQLNNYLHSHRVDLRVFMRVTCGLCVCMWFFGREAYLCGCVFSTKREIYLASGPTVLCLVARPQLIYHPCILPKTTKYSLVKYT